MVDLSDWGQLKRPVWILYLSDVLMWLSPSISTLLTGWYSGVAGLNGFVSVPGVYGPWINTLAF